jgi:deoxyribonuclease-4
MSEKHSVFLGAHMSIAGGIENAYYKGASIGCTALQLFTHSNRQWAMKKLTTESIEKVHTARKETGITHAAVHASYLINLASSNADTRRKSKEMLEHELNHCEALGIQLLIMHPGSNNSYEEGGALISEAINEIFEKNRSNVMILLENMAGQGSQIGYRLDHLAFLKQNIRQNSRIGFCIDTCHLWAAGYDFSKENGYQKVWGEIDSILGREHIHAIHLNDSKQTLNSHVDRHANIGEGTIGLEGFRLIMQDEYLKNIPKILETPGEELSEYAHNMKILLDLRGQ